MAKRGRSKTKEVDQDKKPSVVEGVETKESKTVMGPRGVAEQNPLDAAKVAKDRKTSEDKPVVPAGVAVFEGTGISIVTVEKDGKKIRVSMNFGQGGGKWSTTNLYIAKLLEEKGMKRVA